MDLNKVRNALVRFFKHPAVRYAQIFIVVAGDLLALSNLLPKHCLYIQRPFLIWNNYKYEPEEQQQEEEEEDEEKQE